MKKHVLTLLLTAIMFVLCSCTSSGSNTAYTAPPAAQTSQESSQNMEDGSQENIPTQSENTALYKDTYSLVYDNSHPVSCFGFANDVAWAMLRNDSSSITSLGLINKRSEVVLVLDENSEDPSKNIITPFINGYALVNNTIINQYGEKVFIPDNATRIVGHADDGTFFLTKHIEASFDKESSDYFYIMDDDFVPKDTGIKCDVNISVEDNAFVRLSNGLYYIVLGNNGGAYLNLNNGAWMNGNNNRNYMNIVAFSDDYVAVEKRGYFYLIRISDLATTKSFKEMETLLNDNNRLYINDAAKSSGLLSKNLNNEYAINSWLLSDWNGGSLIREAKQYSAYGKEHFFEYIDFTGNSILRYPDYAEGISYKTVSDFSGGFSALFLNGMDNKEYATIINEAGAIQYDPQLCGDDNCFVNGYIFCYQHDADPFVIAPTGEIKHLGDNLPGLETTNYFSQHDNFSLSINGGFIFWCSNNIPPKYYSCNGLEIIEKVSATYNSDGELIYTDENGDEHTNGTVANRNRMGESSSVASTQKTYMNISNFEIYGKWKNIGTYTFGQVQDSSIVTFDGKYCNIYSPSDIYAIYREGDNYCLDCTSPLGETISFIVRTVDDNNIDIYYGANYLELKRVG